MPITTIADVFRVHGSGRPDKPAIVYGDRRVTYGEFDDRSNRSANALTAEGVGPQDRVAFLDKNTPEYFHLAFGAAKLNVVLCAVNWRLAPSEAAFIINDSSGDRARHRPRISAGAQGHVWPRRSETARSAPGPAETLRPCPGQRRKVTCRRWIDAHCRVAFDASDLVIVVAQNRGAVPSAERPRLRRAERRIMDLWRSVVSAVRPDLRASEVATLVAGILPFVNMYPHQQHVDLPDPALVARLVRSFVLGGE